MASGSWPGKGDQAVADPLEVSSEQLDGMTVVRVDGELDQQTAPILLSALDDAAQAPLERIVIDLAECTFMDSAGSRALGLSARDHNGMPLGVACPENNRPVRLVLELVGLLDELDVRPEVESFRDAPR